MLTSRGDRVVCAGRSSVGGSAWPPVEAQVGRHCDSALTDFAGINGGFDHRSTILAPHRHAARTLAWLWCLPDVRARHRCAGDALLPGKEGYYVRRRAQGGDRGVELLVQTYEEVGLIYDEGTTPPCQPDLARDGPRGEY